MKHKWETKPDEIQLGQKYKVWLCKVCGCKKELANYKFSTPMYLRNGQIYSEYIECIDDEFEKTKTID